MKFLAFFFMLATFAIAYLKIKENMIVTYDMVLYIVIHDTGLERGQNLLRYDHIDVNPKDRWLEDILMLVAKGGHFPIADGFAVDGRRNVGNLKRPLYSVRNAFGGPLRV
ncbi:hypothetical protein PROQFM164_S02g002998 [Penicillium roqueforti FM164]|uniref:Uncharacterized protein n=1 Tax=Penicillium roqueforti (strain FM164) TaxID=1365484 RepID=W6QTI5_PENRF|nr:hypothetical protein PROQFM164_S02g002998 [Penicillium roqueforti FM164]